MHSCLYECTVLHHRFAPRPHRFAYRLFLFAFDLDELDLLHRRLRLFSVDRPNLYAFRDDDFLPTGESPHNPTGYCHVIRDKLPGLKARVLACLSARGIDLTGGRVLLVTLPRVAGYLFNPVSFYFCYDRAGTPVAALAEVTNTFREVKPYLLGPESRRPIAAPAGRPAGATFRLRVPKHFYVSPFSDVDVAFDFALRTPGDHLAVRIDDFAAGRRTLTSTLAGRRQPLTAVRLAWFTCLHPFITLKIIALIHWHALRLWLKRLPWFPKAARPDAQRDLYRPHVSIARSTSS